MVNIIISPKLVLNDIIQNILSCKFDGAYESVKKWPYRQLDELLSKIGFDYGQSLVVYAFAEYLIKQDECIDYHFIAQSILCGALCHIEGAYNVALYHNYRILELDKNNLQAKVMMLFYNTLPNPLLTKPEAAIFAQEILKVEPNNKIALDFLGDHGVLL